MPFAWSTVCSLNIALYGYGDKNKRTKKKVSSAHLCMAATILYLLSLLCVYTQMGRKDGQLQGREKIGYFVECASFSAFNTISFICIGMSKNVHSLNPPRAPGLKAVVCAFKHYFISSPCLQ